MPDEVMISVEGGSISEASPQSQRKDFENTVIKKRDWQAESAHTYKSEVRSVFGWTDVVDAEDECSAENVAQVMGEHQGKLPRLPVPQLEKTAAMFLKTLQPLLTADEFDQAEEEMASFVQNEGPKLQEKLLERSSNADEVTSWLEEWWDDSYLCSRDSIAVNVNYFFGFENDAPEKMCQIGRAASLLHGAMSFYHKYSDETLEMDFERAKPLCMSQMRRVFTASRIPGISRDRIVTYLGGKKLAKVEQISKTSSYSDAEPRHIVVLCGSKFFALNVFQENDNGDVSLLSIPDIEVLLHQVRDISGQIGSGIPVEVATALNRDEWARLRDRLIIHSERNRETLEAIQQALLVVVLESMSPEHDEELSRLLLHGPGVNRWFDNHNLIVCANGKAGINFEHSIGDGATTLRVADEMFTHSVNNGRTRDQVAANIAAYEAHLVKEKKDERFANLPSPHPRGWILDKSIESSLKKAYTTFKEQILTTETQVLQFNQYGGMFVKQVAAMSPDAYVQVALQLAYHRYYGRNDATYEAASTRSFFHGRTEVVRSATPEVALFCKTLESTSVTHRAAGQKLPTQLRLLREAVLAHVAYMKEAKTAQGYVVIFSHFNPPIFDRVDRHLLGLRMTYEDNIDLFDFELPAIFKGKGYRKSSHWNLSTSHCGSSSLRMFGFGPVVNDGFGVGYMIKNNGISFNVTGKFGRNTNCQVFAALLEESLLHMKAIALMDPEKVDKSASKSLEFTHPTSHTDDMLAAWLRTGVRTTSFRKDSTQ